MGRGNPIYALPGTDWDVVGGRRSLVSDGADTRGQWLVGQKRRQGTRRGWSVWPRVAERGAAARERSWPGARAFSLQVGVAVLCVEAPSLCLENPRDD
ncbi:hypothetical protein PI125_g372 [Phytophthora idaei]|nr:hypothetical protein PI125_g372 [Phytophthora idaei]